MLRRSRVGTTPEMGRISMAVSRPGIDPRIWFSIAYANGESQLDAKHGDFVDVVLLPSQLEVTARVPQDFAGAGFGANKGRIHNHDELLIAFPDGDPSTGGIVQARLWSAADLPPQLVADNPADQVVVAEKDTNERLLLQGSGYGFYETANKFVWKTPSFRIGDDDAIEQLVLGTTYRSKENAMNVTLAASWGTLAALVTAAASALTSAGALQVIPIAGAVMAAPFLTAAGAALTSLGAQVPTLFVQPITQFDPAATEYLSNVGKTK